MHFHTLAIKNKNNKKHLFPDLLGSESRKVLFNERKQWLDIRLPRLPRALRKASLFSKKSRVHQQREWSLWKQPPEKGAFQSALQSPEQWQGNQSQMAMSVPSPLAGQSQAQPTVNKHLIQFTI